MMTATCCSRRCNRNWGADSPRTRGRGADRARQIQSRDCRSAWHQREDSRTACGEYLGQAGRALTYPDCHLGGGKGSTEHARLRALRSPCCCGFQPSRDVAGRFLLRPARMATIHTPCKHSYIVSPMTCLYPFDVLQFPTIRTAFEAYFLCDCRNVCIERSLERFFHT